MQDTIVATGKVFEMCMKIECCVWHCVSCLIHPSISNAVINYASRYAYFEYFKTVTNHILFIIFGKVLRHFLSTVHYFTKRITIVTYITSLLWTGEIGAVRNATHNVSFFFSFQLIYYKLWPMTIYPTLWRKGYRRKSKLHVDYLLYSPP